MTAVTHAAVANHRPNGLLRHYAECPCGWTRNANGKKDAERLATDHNKVAHVAAELRHECLGSDLEFYPGCLKCDLESVLERAS